MIDLGGLRKCMLKWLPCSAVLISVVPFFFSGCASSPVMMPPAVPLVQPGIPDFSVPIEPMRKTIMHTVAPLETVWRLSKMYDVSVADIIAANDLNAKAELKVGEALRIPNASAIKTVIPLYASNKWKYIIVHHSATDAGSALSIDRVHHQRGFWNGLGYHFLINNGTQGKLDGQLEVAPRWVKQQNGAHCKANNMNERAIGICLVGDFSHNEPSAMQMKALAHAVKTLQEYYHIPKRNILGHGQVTGANTECPGKRFPWTYFLRMIA